MEDVVSKLRRVLSEVEDLRRDPLNPVSVNVGIVIHIAEDEVEGSDDIEAEICTDKDDD